MFRFEVAARRYARLLGFLWLCAACAEPQPPGLALYASLPLNGPAAPRAQAELRGLRLALAEQHEAACGGRYPLRLIQIDNATDGVWDATLEAAAANKAATDSSAAAYLGSFEPGPLLVSLPILNMAGPMLVVAPMNTYPAFTQARAAPDQANEYYPTGRRNLLRLGPTDYQAGEAAAHWAGEAGLKTAYVLYDLYDPNQQGLNTARGFEYAAAALQLNVIGSLGIDRFAGEYDSVMYQISQESDGGRPDLVLYAGPPAGHLATLFAAEQSWFGGLDQMRVVSLPGYAADSFAASAGPAAEGTLLLSPALPVDQWPASGRRFASAYDEAQSLETDTEALYGYAAGQAILRAIESVCVAGDSPLDRGAVLQTALPPEATPGEADSDLPLPPPDEFGLYRITGGTLDFSETTRASE